MKTYFCWRCGQDMPFLEEDEWQKIEPLLSDAVKDIKAYRQEHNCDIAKAKANIKPEATKLFKELTGMPNVDYEIIYHHRLAYWGKECDGCGYLLRSSRASFCAKCGKKSNDS